VKSMRDGKVRWDPPTMSMLFVDGEPVLRLAGKVQFGGGRTAGGRQMQNETGLLRTSVLRKEGGEKARE
jgi:hypothetical protein